MMGDYTAAIYSLQNEIDKRTYDFNKEIEPLKLALGALKKVNNICLKCGGQGTMRRSDAAGQVESIKCLDCFGSGITKESEDK